MSRRREEQDLLDKMILETLSKGHIHWTDLEKRVIATCRAFATRGRFDNRLRYLLKKGYVKRVSRGIYKVTEGGRKYMDVLSLSGETASAEA